jgi:protein-S-isoprenylcysteine O-methyltransferase Ste14
MYRFIRNPMYAALVAVLLGESALFRSWRLVGYALGVWLVLHVLVVLYEERGLTKAFGDSFRRYRERVPRWIPRVHPPAS